MNQMIGSTETSIYIIDKDYKIVHFNKALEKIFPDLKCGDICYQVLCRESQPCYGCPLLGEEKDNTIFYNKERRQWLEVSTGVMDWPGSGSCNIVLAREIYEGNKNLFFNLTSKAAYDELFELNITRDTYKILYHVKDKYVISPIEGKLADMLQDVVDHMIHPEDRGAFLEFWDLDNILPRLYHSSESHSLKGQFRKKTTKGEYCWVLQTVVPLLYGESDDKIIMCFIQDIDEEKKKEAVLQNSCSLKDILFDPLTGLYKRTVFFQTAKEFLKNVEDGSYCLMAIDIEHFKLFNEWYGQEKGDKFLINISSHLKKAQKEMNGISGYMGADDFCIILPADENLLSKLQEQISSCVMPYRDDAGFLPAFGIYLIEDKNVPVSMMYDRAIIALESVKGNYARRTGWYDAQMMQKMEENHVLLSEVQRALENQEFTFYIQPQCNMITGKIVGLESLVRWNHPERGLIPPNEFIPLLENNGFITNLDIYIWDKVCCWVRKWIDGGHRPIPIAVNVSRVDVYTIDIVEKFRGLTEKYQLDPGLLEIEITESAYTEETQIITSVVDDLRRAGFTVLMDDFGSGYSSLNMLKDVNVDVLKMDMRFLDMTARSAGRGMGILEAVSSMARLIDLRIIAEGVETKEVVELLVDLGCIYGQGYYFYKPMPMEAVEELMENEDHVDFRGIKANKIERLRVKELLNEDIFSDVVMNNILGGIAFYDVCQDQIELLRVNEQYYRVTGTNPVDLEERRQAVLEDIYEEDRHKVLDIFREARENPVNGAEGDIRRIKGDGSVIWMHFHTFFFREQDGHSLYYGSVSDVTEQKLREQQLESSQRALLAVAHISEHDEGFMKLGEENRRIAAAIFAQMSPGGMIGVYCEEGYPLYFANYEMVNLLGYGSYDEFREAIKGKVINIIHPEDWEQAAKDIGPGSYPGLEYTTAYRMLKKDGSWFWTMDKGKIIQAEDGRLAAVSACTDIMGIAERCNKV